MIRTIRLRTLLIGGVFTLFFVLLAVRVYWVQIVDSAWLVGEAQKNWHKSQTIPSQRGAILDRNGNLLAEDGPSYNVAIDPNAINKNGTLEEVVQGLSAILGKPEQQLRELATAKTEKGAFWNWREVRSEGWNIDNEVADQIKEQFAPARQVFGGVTNFKEYGIYLMPQSKRYYPGGRLASHILGFINKEGKATQGIEYYYDNILHGTDGKIETAKDPQGNELPGANVYYEAPIDGNNVKLTIDKQIQSYMESAMETSFQKWRPKAMSAIALNPQTMEILGMVSLPNFNPNKYWQVPGAGDLTNHAISGQFEPGSTFKLVTLAAAVEEGIFKPNDSFMSGSITLPGGDKLHDHDRAGWGAISYLDGLKRSSNVAFVKLGYEQLGEAKLREYIERFGFGQKTGVDMPAEAKGTIRFRYPTEIATATYGQGGVAVSVMQLAAAYGAIANGGKLMTPYIVKEIDDAKTGQVIQRTEPKFVRQVVSEETARKVSEYLEQVVSDQKIGTGKSAYIEGVRIAGKTGTANKVINGRYSTDRWIISFAGYAPAEDPKILFVIVSDEPDLKGDYHLGSNATQPAFREMMLNTLRYMGITSAAQEAQISEKDYSVSVPQVTDQPLSQAKKTLDTNKIGYEVLGNGTKVLQQYPQPGTEIGLLERMILLTDRADQVKLPNLNGKSMRDALAICSMLQVNCAVAGEGYVTSQKKLEGGTDVMLELHPWGEKPNESGKEDAAKGKEKEAAKEPAGGAQTSSTKTGSSKVSASARQ
ncbi:penicillin-binding transpeptidase domain-containing protein [Paenibacillus sp. y28]|uniref:penicillin-binding transpeptidase domain-containing protein n=1 Tax=Paenibacillus sp. y28 TaxID=3129110 RepID=UPI00301864DD